MLVHGLLMTSALLLGQPTPEQVMGVFDHYYSGQGRGMIVADAALCEAVEKRRKDTKHDCLRTHGTAAELGDPVFVYLTLLIPKGEEKTFMVQALHNGIVRSTKDVTLKSRGMRTRTYRGFSLSKVGRWQFKVLDGVLVLKTLEVEVTDPRP